MSEIKEIKDATKFCKEEIQFYKNELKEPYLKAYLPAEEDYCKGHSEAICKCYSNIKEFEFIISVLTEKLEREQKWISVSERLPKMKDGLCSGKVLVAYGVNDKQILFGWYRINEWVNSDMNSFVRQELVTHWMPLPQQPRNEVTK